MKNLKDIIIERLHLGKNTMVFNSFEFKELNIKVKLPFNVLITDFDEIVEIYNIEQSKDTYSYLFLDKNDKLVFKLNKAFGIENLFINQIKDPKIKLTPKLYNVNGKQINSNYNIELYDPDDIISEAIDTKHYANIILINENNEILILQRANYMRKYPGKWGFPGGHIQSNEDSKTAILRELKEETGIELTWNEANKCKKYDSIINDDGSISDYWIATIENKPEVKISKEHSRYEWFNDKSKKPHKWMPDVFQIIQKIL